MSGVEIVQISIYFFIAFSALIGFAHDLSDNQVGEMGHQVNTDIHLQTVEIQMRRLLIIRIFTVCFLNIFYSNN